MHRFIAWAKESSDFVPCSDYPPGLPLNAESQPWWHATPVGGASSSSLVTHLGDRPSAQTRADAKALGRRTPAVLYKVQLPARLRVMQEVYVENSGNEAMDCFEQRLLDSEADLAYYWNSKESEAGAWSLVARRSAIGELPHAPTPGVRILLAEEWAPGPYFEQLSRHIGPR